MTATCRRPPGDGLCPSASLCAHLCLCVALGVCVALCRVSVSRVCVACLVCVSRRQLRAFNDHGVSGVSARSVFVAWELHRRDAADEALGDELLVNENSSIVRRVVHVPVDGPATHLLATATEEQRAKDWAAEQTALQQRVGRHGGFAVHGRGHPVRRPAAPRPASLVSPLCCAVLSVVCCL